MNLRGSEWLIILVLVVVLFGAKRLPDAARGIGRSLRVFRSEVKGLSDDEKAEQARKQSQQQAQGLPSGDAEPRESH